MTSGDPPPAAVQALLQVSQLAAGGGQLRSRDEIRGLLGGLRLIPPAPGAEPEVTWVDQWNAGDQARNESADSRWLYCAVATSAA
jgi:hypothetical protein